VGGTQHHVINMLKNVYIFHFAKVL